ncbi:EAL domain-containing protein [Treponema brennaborense]|uniref:Diguanylate phosphodiesterase n=1 Tax=Treponema brennaborense (strain DSM 12168 / CIP 105900 / DD5/3) TaxID=906968 RepID=F4LJ39_TREBD|nr:EAL domain-containing protein [Treponema brennaborense]AEE16296.1 diguanylate phosphodiesterase [Treponema brennaborense DSM 12168]
MPGILNQKHIRSYFQPIVCLKTGQIFAYEALVRGIHPDYDTVISPSELFAAADAQNVSAEFDKICQQSALEYFSSFRKNSHSLLFMNINTSLISPDDVSTSSIQVMTRKMGFDPCYVGLELIESRAASADDLISFVEHYRESGFLIVIDDFGCEHSNMERLIQIRPDIIKIDRSIIAGIESDVYRQSILKSIHMLSEMTGSLCLAEGVETVEEVVTCYLYGVDLFQGYAIARPDADLQLLETETLRTIARLRDRLKRESVETLRQKRRLTGDINSLADWLVRQITPDNIDAMEPVLQEFIVLNPEIECVYLLDKNGVQISNTISSPFLKIKPRSYIFSPAQKGADNSFKSYFTCFEAFKISRYLTDPYLSYASGNLCRTLSVKLCSAADCMVLCIDFIEEIIKTPVLKK